MRRLVVCAVLALVLVACGGSRHAPATVARTSDAGRNAGVTSPAPATVGTTSGRLRGVLTGSAREFLGVRFAAPPVGKLRWAPPQPASRASGTVDASKPGHRCAQTGAMGTSSTAEDCLFLNVTTPRGGGKDLPVMVWWHGGGYVSGAGSDYDAQRMASQGNVVVVTANARLGIFGYFGLPGLRGGGDFGLEDQIAALRWAKANAQAIGGDPDNITVFGESSGGMSTCALLTSPTAQGLVEKAAISSGSCLLNWPDGGLVPGDPAQTPYTSIQVNHGLSTAIAKQLGCRGAGAAACMRKLPAQQLVSRNIDFSDVLAYGTPLLPQNPAAAVRAGQIARIPILSGGNRDEERSFMAGALDAKPSLITHKTYPMLLAQAFKANASAVAKQYPLHRYPSPGLAFATVMTDAAWACPTLTGNQLMSKATTVYPYEFADETAPNVNGVHSLPQGAAHATDTPYLFDLGGKDLLKTPAQHKLANTMVADWTHFAHTGTPGWTKQTPHGTQAQRFTPAGPRLGSVAAEHHCGFWSSIGRKLIWTTPSPQNPITAGQIGHSWVTVPPASSSMPILRRALRGFGRSFLDQTVRGCPRRLRCRQLTRAFGHTV